MLTILIEEFFQDKYER